jgi:hypothetical protein
LSSLIVEILEGLWPTETVIGLVAPFAARVGPREHLNTTSTAVAGYTDQTRFCSHPMIGNEPNFYHADFYRWLRV